MPVPSLDAEQRQAGYQRSLALRQARAAIKQHVRENGPQAVKHCFTVAEAQGMRIVDLLVCLPGVGVKKAASILRLAGIAPGTTVKGCRVRQLERLFGELDRRTQ